MTLKKTNHVKTWSYNSLKMISIKFVFVQDLELVFQVRWEFWPRLQQEAFHQEEQLQHSQLKKNNLPEDEEEEEEGFTSPF